MHGHPVKSKIRNYQTSLKMQTYYRLYAKFSFQNKFKALDLDKGTQVENLIYATIIPSENLGKVQKIIDDNSEIQFKLVKIK